MPRSWHLLQQVGCPPGQPKLGTNEPQTQRLLENKIMPSSRHSLQHVAQGSPGIPKHFFLPQMHMLPSGLLVRRALAQATARMAVANCKSSTGAGCLQSKQHTGHNITLCVSNGGSHTEMATMCPAHPSCHAACHDVCKPDRNTYQSNVRDEQCGAARNKGEHWDHNMLWQPPTPK
jgi:hypothetical protein